MGHDVGHDALVGPAGTAAGTRMRCPEEEIGRNSVMPWIRASTMICSIGMMNLGGPRESLAARGSGFYMRH